MMRLQARPPRPAWRRARSSISMSRSAGSKRSRRTRRGISAPSSAANRSRIGPSFPRRGQPDRFVEGASFVTRPRARRPQPVAALGDRLVADRDLFVPTFDPADTLEAGHHLVERGARATNAVSGDDSPDLTAGQLAVLQNREDQELQMGCDRHSVRHNATLCTIGLDGGEAAERFACGESGA